MGFDLQTDLLRNHLNIISDLGGSDYWVSKFSAIFSLGIGLRSGQRPVSGFGPGEGIPKMLRSWLPGKNRIISWIIGSIEPNQETTWD